MATTYTLISSNTLGSNTASVSFNSIPNTYTDLLVKFSLRASNVGTVGDLYIKLNGDSSSIYSNTNLYAETNPPASSRTTNTTSIFSAGGVGGTSVTANTFTNGEIYIPSYTASQNKATGTSSTVENNSASGFTYYLYEGAGLYRSTTAISSITFTTNLGSFVTNSSFYLYGIKNS